jgi:hypothetical protein
VAVGKVVAEFLTQQGFPKLFTPVIHYSGQAVRARKKAIADHKDSFEAFKNSVSPQISKGDIVATGKESTYRFP